MTCLVMTVATLIASAAAMRGVLLMISPMIVTVEHMVTIMAEFVAMKLRMVWPAFLWVWGMV